MEPTINWQLLINHLKALRIPPSWTQDDRDDATQATIEKILQHWANGGRVDNLTAYATTIYKNVVKDTWRRKVVKVSALAAIHSNLPSQAEDPNAEIATEFMAAWIRALDENERAVVAKYLGDEKPYSTLAEETNLSEWDVRMILGSARRKLVAALALTPELARLILRALPEEPRSGKIDSTPRHRTESK